jgi:hypothetical protein
VRFVDRDDADPAASQEGDQAIRSLSLSKGEPLGGDVQQVELTGEVRLLARTPLATSASTWSCMSAMSGLTTSPVPGRTRAGTW